jgi:type IV pilus assembly protein PilB
MLKQKSDEILASLLIKKGFLTVERVEAAELRIDEHSSLADVLVRYGMVDSSVIQELTRSGGFNPVDLSEYHINPAAIAALPETFARRYNVIPIDFEDNKLVVAVIDPTNVLVQDDLQMITGHEIKTVVALEHDIDVALNRCYKASNLLESSHESPVDVIEAGNSELSGMKAVMNEAPVIKLVNMMLIKAVNERASDIHIEPQEKDLKLRYRIDGVLHEILRSPKPLQPGIISRLKIMAGLDIAETRIPQDGHCDLNIGGKMIDFRVSSLPTIYGERVVLRVLRKESILIDLNDLGFLPQSLEDYKSAFTKPYGSVLVTGPTGSGKSTSLYATLNVLNNSTKNIITVEDPVEYRLPGINQIQINQKCGLTFSRVLRAMLRSSPDIVMVGEMRDKETSQIAIEAALTGHLVLSTLHTNDAPGAISRLTEMGIPPFLTASSVECVLAQRLARRLCPDCKEPYTPSVEALRRIGFPLPGDEVPTLYKQKGCPKCNNTGYKGRLGIYEVMLMTDDVKELCVKRAAGDEIKRVAVNNGMKTLKYDGYEKVLLGHTSIEEIMRVIV